MSELIEIFVPVASMGSLGLLFGALLAYASQKFAVDTDQRFDQILEILPGANCGGCSYPGCSGLAGAIVDGSAPVDACPVASAETHNAIAGIMGADKIKSTEKKVARLLCSGDNSCATDKYHYHGLADCVSCAKLGNGYKSCSYGCLGLGTCVQACRFGAISIKNGIAHIDETKCTSCGACVKSCPKNLIQLTPKHNGTWVMCSSKDKGALVKDMCKSGCIACGLCVRNCAFDAITVTDNLAVIDYSKCVDCSQCAAKCPKNTIRSNTATRRAEIIALKCIGCTVCKKQCKFDAIRGDVKKIHRIDVSKCVGCGLCAGRCPAKAIEMIEVN